MLPYTPKDDFSQSHAYRFADFECGKGRDLVLDLYLVFIYRYWNRYLGRKDWLGASLVSDLEMLMLGCMFL